MNKEQNFDYPLSFLQRLANATFFLLFPGFIIYHSLLAYGLVRPIAIGYITVVATLFLVSASLRLACQFISDLFRRDPFFYTFLFFVCYICTYAAFKYSTDPRPHIAVAASQTFHMLGYAIFMFILGRNINLGHLLTSRILLYWLLGFCIFLLIYCVIAHKLMFNAAVMAPGHIRQYVASYQAFSSAAAVVSTIAVCSPVRFSQSICIYLISGVVLFLLGTRSELIGFVISGAIVIFLRGVSRDQAQFLILFVTSLLGFAAILLLFHVFDFSGFVQENRIFQLLDLSSSSSWAARNRFFDSGLGDILAHPFNGTFGGHVITHGTTGSYIHNALSAWANFGLLPFILYIALLVQPLLAILRKSFSASLTNQDLFIFAFGAEIVILAAVAKSVYWGIPPFYWGIYCATRHYRIGRLAA